MIDATLFASAGRRAAIAGVLALAIPAAGAAQTDFRESVLDGAWVGTATKGAAVLPLGVVLNVNAAGGVASVLSLEGNDVVALPATVTAITGASVTLRVDEAEAPGRRPATTLTLQYKTLRDSLEGTASADKAVLRLVRMAGSATLQRLWSGSVRVDGVARRLVLQLEEGDDTGRAPASVAGNFWVDGERGAVAGTREGTTFDLQLDVDGVAYTLAGRISKGLQLKGKLSGEGSAVNVKLVAAPGRGKPTKLVPPAPSELEAGTSQAVTIKGRNFAPGTLIELNDPLVSVTQVSVRSAKLIEATLAIDENAADGATLDLRALGSDGQNPERRGAFVVEVPDTGGTGVSFATAVQPIFTASCALAGCHSAGSAEAGLVLASGAALQNLVNVPSTQLPSLRRVLPGDADASYLVRKIRGDGGISGGRMPLNRPPLAAEQIATIVAWINQGAANNGPQR